MDGWIKLWRKSLDSAVFSKPELWRLWSYCLMRANHTEVWVPIDGLVEPVRVLPGQFITGRQALHTALYPKPSRNNPKPITTWRWLLLLRSMGNLALAMNSRYTLVTVAKWETYQNGQPQDDQANDQPVISRRSAGDQPVITDKNVKKEKNEKKKASWDSERGWKDIAEEEQARWAKAYPAVDVPQELRRMDAWCRANPKKAHKSNWARFIVNWLRREQDRGGSLRGRKEADTPDPVFERDRLTFHDLNTFDQQAWKKLTGDHWDDARATKAWVEAGKPQGPPETPKET